MDKEEAHKTTKRILNDEEFSKKKDEIEELKKSFKFKRAIKELSKLIVKYPNCIWYKQQLALCRYKDPETQPHVGLEEAIKLLKSIGLTNPKCKDAQTIALGGAISKRLWHLTGRIKYLYQALFYYREAYKRNPDEDKGFGGINAAYVLDILASRVRKIAAPTGTSSEESNQLQFEANKLREKIVKQLSNLPKKDYSVVLTLSEAFFGLERYTEAGEELAKAKELNVPEFEMQRTTRRLISIARLKGIPLPIEKSVWHEAWQALAQLLVKETEFALSCYRGKVGLALSGGGFRASFFHIGVLARLAEMSVLQNVEVLSTVSGGSIIGTYYYLKVKKKLENTKDHEISRKDYIEIVKDIQKDFIKGVEKNIRTRALRNIRKNLKILRFGTYTLSHRLGELFEEILYDTRKKKQPLYMDELLIQPVGETDNFHPIFSNWRRKTKVPALLLNATSLNSGHNWRFTALSMGEPPHYIDRELDTNRLYDRIYYEDDKKKSCKQNYRLGSAVAASAAVPGLFDPLVGAKYFDPSKGSIEKKRTVRLVDGGVYDNQGIQGLLWEGCSLILCSDAAGQMDEEISPSDSMFSVPLRSNIIQMERVRQASYSKLLDLEDAGVLNSVFFVHLKKDLHRGPSMCLDGFERDADRVLPSDEQGSLTSYGIDADVQKQLAAIRTDLDSFTEVEAYSLMCSGYLMTEQQFKKLQKKYEKMEGLGNWEGFCWDAPRKEDTWEFLKLEPILKLPKKDNDPRRKDLDRQLNVANHRFFKIWRLNPTLKILTLFGVVGASFSIGWFIWKFWQTTYEVPIVAIILLFLVPIILIGLVQPVLDKYFPINPVGGILRNFTLAFFGYLGALLHVPFDIWFRWRGRLQRLLDMAS